MNYLWLMWYNWTMNSTSPKGRVANIAGLMHPDGDVEVRGTRVKGRFGGHFLAEVNVNGNTIARARHQNWRKAYRGLEIELSKIGIL